MSNSSKLIDYLDNKLGKGRGSTNREYFCFACIDRVGSESTARKLRIDPYKGMAYCNRCNYSAGSVERLLKDMTHGRLTMVEMAIIRDERRPPEEGILEAVQTVLTRMDRPKKPNPVPLPPDNFPLTAGQSWTSHPQAVKPIAYLESRGISLETAARYDIRHCLRGPFGGYLIFPITLYGVQVYWTNRYAGDRPMYIPAAKFLKTKNHTGMEGDYGKSDVLFGFDQCVGQETVGVGEGPFDAMSMSGVGLLGKQPSPAQIALLVELVRTGTKEFVVGLDPDAIREAERLRASIAGIVDRVTYLPITHGDPSSRHDELPDLMADRIEERSLVDRVRMRLNGHK